MRLHTYDMDVLSTEIQSVCISGFKDDSLFFYAYCRCLINDSGNKGYSFFTARCRTLCSEGFERVFIAEVCSGNRACIPEIPLGDDLVPLIGWDNIDAMSKRLTSYIKNELRIFVDPSDGYALAQALGLEVKYIPFDDSRRILGQLLFDASDINTMHNGKKQTYRFDAKTIILNKTNPHQSLSGCDNNTILHECIHWLLHRYAYRLAREFNNNSASAVFRSYTTSVCPSWNSIESMEWQASSISPRILLSEAKIRAIVCNYSRQSEESLCIGNIGRAVRSISAFCAVSEPLVRIRLSELGYESAKREVRKKQRYTFIVSPTQAVCEYANNEALQNLLSKGTYAYVDGRFCQVDDRYIFKNPAGELHITPYVKTHQEECCLRFITRSQYIVSSDRMYRGRAATVSLSSAPDDAINLTKQTIELTNLLQTLPSTYSGTLRAHIKRSGLTTEKLAEICEISEKTIQRYKASDETECELPILVALCVGLKLHPILSFDLLSKAGYGSLRSSKKHTAYKLILLTMYE